MLITFRHNSRRYTPFPILDYPSESFSGNDEASFARVSASAETRGYISSMLLRSGCCGHLPVFVLSRVIGTMGQWLFLQPATNVNVGTPAIACSDSRVV